MQHDLSYADRAMRFTFEGAKDFPDIDPLPHMIQYRKWLKAADRFNLSNDFISIVAGIIQNDDAVPNNLHLARLPYPVMWMEFDAHHFYRILEEHGQLIKPPYANIESASKMTGILLVRDPVHETRYVAFKFDDVALSKSKNPQVDSVCLYVDTESPIGERYSVFNTCTILQGLARHLSGVDTFLDNPNIREAVDGLVTSQSLVPAGYHKDDREQYEKFPWVRHMSTGIEPLMRALMNRGNKLNGKQFEQFSADITKTLAHSMKEQRGFGRFVITTLALINNVPVDIRPVIRTGRQTIRQYHADIMSYKTITLIKVPKINPVKWYQKRLDKEAAFSRAFRGRRGHFAHRHGMGLPDDKCQHLWISPKPNHEECVHCHRYRWWRPEVADPKHQHRTYRVDANF